MFMNSLSRIIDLDYYGKSNDTLFENITTYVYTISNSSLQDMAINKANENFEVGVSGTSNLTRPWQSYAFWSKGHYLDIAESVREKSIPSIIDMNNNTVEAD